MNADLKKKKWDVLQHLSEIVQRMPEGRPYGGWREPKVSNALMFLEALGMIEKRYRGGGRMYFIITPLGKEILKGHITKALLGEEK